MSVPPLDNTHVRGRACDACQMEGSNHSVYVGSVAFVPHMRYMCRSYGYIVMIIGKALEFPGVFNPNFTGKDPDL